MAKVVLWKQVSLVQKLFQVLCASTLWTLRGCHNYSCINDANLNRDRERERERERGDRKKKRVCEKYRDRERGCLRMREAAGTNATRLGYFWKELLLIILKSCPNIYRILGIFDKCHDLCKNCSVCFLGNFYENFCYFKSDHLVTLAGTNR